MVKILKHPLIDIKLTKMRDKDSSHTTFKKNLNEIASLMVYEILRDYKPEALQVETPTGSIAHGSKFNNDIVIVPILRAGLGMVAGIEALIPQARIGHVGVYRDEETFEIHEYFYKMPIVNKDKADIIVVDPMLATGASAIDTIHRLKIDGFKNIKLVCLVGAPEGVKALEKAYPDVTLFLASLDEKLNDKKYIIPGLGDAGDRIFGTK
ncbi:MAG: uracil phosphoribosyltransferase [Mycoplasmataceae bacterium]|nr:uracil phosphoribosyltransferase [Mycoplasmataceae bacterium]